MQTGFTGENGWVILSPIEIAIKRKIEAVGTPLKDWNINIYRGILTGYNEAFIINEETKNELIQKSGSTNLSEIIRPILRGRDIQKYNANWGGLYLLTIHNGYVTKSGKNIPAIDINKYPIVKDYLDKYWDQINNRQDKGNTPYNLRSCIYMEDFFKHKIVWKRIGSVLRFSYDQQGLFCLDSTCFATGRDMKYLVGYLNSTISKRELLNNSPKTGTGDVITSVQALEPLLIPTPTLNQKESIVALVDEYLSNTYLKSNHELSTIENQIDSIFFEVYGFDANEIDYISSV